MLSEPSAPAFGKETKCPAGIQGNSRFTLQNSPSLSVLFRLYPGHKIKVNQGQSSQIKVKKIKKYWRKNAQLISRFHRDGSVLFAGGSTAPFFGRFPNEG
jgi:hypothetical protein